MVKKRFINVRGTKYPDKQYKKRYEKKKAERKQQRQGLGLVSKDGKNLFQGTGFSRKNSQKVYGMNSIDWNKLIPLQRIDMKCFDCDKQKQSFIFVIDGFILIGWLLLMAFIIIIGIKII